MSVLHEPKTLLLGIGNLIMSDDGIGVRIIQRIQREYSLPGHVEVIDGGTLGLDLLPLLEQVERLLVVDAVETGKVPGSCIRLSGEELPIALETKVSPHQMGLKDLLAVARLMGHLPPEMVLIGVQPGSIEMSSELTPEIEAKMDLLVESVLNELAKWGVCPEPKQNATPG